MFRQFKDNTEFSQAIATLARLYKLYLNLSKSDKTEDNIEAHQIWRELGDSYWDILFALIDAKLENTPDQLQFDYDERLFVDLGYMPGIMEIHSEFDPRAFLSAKCHGGIFPVMNFSDYISSYWAIMNGKEAPDPNLGENLEGRINAVQEDLIKAQEVRDKYLIEIADSFNVNLNSRQAAEDLDNNLLSAMKYSLRVPEYREGSEDIRLQISRERKLFLDTENAVMLMISSAQQAGDNPLPVFEAEAFKNMHETTKILAKKLLYSQMDERKIQRRNQKLTESCTDMTDTMRKTALKEMLEKKKEYMTVPAKNARCDMSLLCQSAELPADYIESAAEIERLSSLDIEMFNVPRVRMYTGLIIHYYYLLSLPEALKNQSVTLLAHSDGTATRIKNCALLTDKLKTTAKNLR